MKTATCPSREMLLGYTVGTVAEDAAEQIANHLSGCSECDQTVQALETSADTMISALRQTPQEDLHLAEPEFREAMQRLRKLRLQPAIAEAGQPSPRPAPSRRAAVLGDYELLKKLGQGGMGAVYMARHKKLKRIVAVKVLPKERLQNAEAVARFEREMEAVGRLDHPHIIRAMDAREIDGIHFLVMEYVEGLDLAQIVRSCGGLSVADACEVVRQAAIGLQCSHENGLVHRDIKPSNLMLTTAGEVKVLDLGLAQIQQTESPEGEITGANQVMGTPDYMSPEQALGSHNVDIRTDIYSLGCTLHHLLAGRAPFSGPQYDSPMKKLLAHVHDDPPAIEFVRADIPKPVAALVGQMLAKAPQVRPASPSAVIDALAPFCEGSKLIGLLREARRKEQPAAESEASRVETGELRGSMDVETSRDASQMLYREESPGEPLEFDPYHRWLGIPREEQPANYYRLLGVVPFEGDAEVIRDAAARQMAHVRTYHLGQHAELSQRILNELAAAKACLLNARKKVIYDVKLREELGPAVRTHKPVSGQPEVAAVVPAMSGTSLEIRLPRISPTRRPLAKRRVLSGLALPRKPLIGVAVGAMFLVILFGIVLSMRTREGTLVVEIDDPEATVQVLGDEEKILIQGKGDKGKLILGVDPGRRRLRVEKDGMVLFAQDFSIAPGGKEMIRARLEMPAPENQDGPPQHETATAPPRKQTIAARRETPVAEKANMSPQRGIVEATESGSRSTFEHSLMTPDLFDTFSCCSGQYGLWNQWRNADVIEAEGVKLWGGHTLTALWAPVTVGTAYSVSLESRLTKEQWFCPAHLLLGGPGYGNSLESSYCVLIDGKMAVLQREGVEQCRAPLQSPIPGGEWFRVDADVNAGHVLVRVNGMPVLDFTDREPLAGPLHAWIGFLGGYQETWYRNLRISGPALSEGATREFLPPVTAAPLPSGPVIYELPINPQALDKDWWLSMPEAVNVQDGSLDLRGFNALSQLILNRPLRGNVAVEVEMEYPTHEALNFSLALWTADALPRELESRAGGWLVWLPNNRSMSTLQWHGGPDQFDWIWTSKSNILAKTPYHVPLLDRRYVVRLEAVGDQARVFLDGRLLLEGKRPADAAGKDLPFYAAIGQAYSPVLVHAVRVYQLTQTSFSTSNGRGARNPKGSLTGALKTSNPSIEEKTFPARANAVRDSDRQVAEWAIGIGGIASVVSGGQSLAVSKTADLPQEPVSIRQIDFRGNQQLRDEDLHRLQGLKDLGRVMLSDTRIGDEGLVHLKAIESLCSVHLHYTAVTDRGLECLAGLSRLEGLGLTHTAVTGSFLEHFQGHPALVVLELDSSQVNDVGMQWLEGLPNLDRLQISHTRVTDAGLAHLKSLGKLRSLHASDLRVTDAGLVSLKWLERLENLELCVTQVTDAGLKHLAGLCNLKRLLLKDAPIGDDGLRHLQTLVGLEYLSLVRTQVSDQGLAHLAAIPSLTRLELHGSRATSKGVAALRTALPKCDISGVGD